MEDWRALLAPDVRNFVISHAGADVSALALKKPPHPDWPYRLILDQIKARAKAAVKAPHWLTVPDIVFPHADLMEQASSWACALYKAGLVEGGERIADLTAGAGIDSAALAQKAEGLICVEKDAQNAAILEHNLGVLHASGVFSGAYEVHCADSQDFVSELPPCDWVYVDPQRRAGGKKGLYLFSDCSPDIQALLPRLNGRAGHVLLKSSPVMDIGRGIEALGGVCAVHIVQWGGECKEVLYIIDPHREEHDVPCHAVEIDDAGGVLFSFSFTLEEERAAQAEIGAVEAYIYEPGPAFLKAGAFNLLAVRFGLRKLHKNTHLYTSDRRIDGFPGKVYVVKDIRSAGDGTGAVRHAELILRNYPGTAEALRARLKLLEGSEARIFACTTVGEKRKLIICSKIACNDGKKQ